MIAEMNKLEDKACNLAVEKKKKECHLSTGLLVTAVNTLLLTIALVNLRNTLT